MWKERRALQPEHDMTPQRERSHASQKRQLAKVGKNRGRSLGAFFAHFLGLLHPLYGLEVEKSRVGWGKCVFGACLCREIKTKILCCQSAQTEWRVSAMSNGNSATLSTASLLPVPAARPRSRCCLCWQRRRVAPSLPHHSHCLCQFPMQPTPPPPMA